MANDVKITLAGDPADAVKAFKEFDAAAERTTKQVKDTGDSIDRSLRDAGDGATRSLRSAADGLDRFSEAGDIAEQRATGFRDGLTGAQDSAAALGEIARGNLFEGLLLAGSGMADLASTSANFVGPALKNVVTRLGAVRLALIGTAAAAALGVGAWLLFANQTADADEEVRDFRKDLDLLIRTGQASGGLKRLFGDGESAAVNMTEALSVLDDRIIQTRDDFLRPIATDQQEKLLESFKALDSAVLAQIDSGTDARVVYQQLADAYGATNVQAAIQKGLLPSLATAMDGATDRGELLADAVEATADEYRIASRELQTFADLLRSQTSPVFGWLDAQDQVTAAQRALNEAINEFGPESEEARQAQRDLAQSELGLVDATARLAEVNETELLRTLQALRSDGKLSAESMDVLTTALGLTKGAVDNLHGSRARIEITQVIHDQFDTPAGRKFGHAVFSVLHSGGVVPGPRGTEVAAILQAGEEVSPLHETGGSSGAAPVPVVVGDRWLSMLLEELVQQIRDRGGDPGFVLRPA